MNQEVDDYLERLPAWRAELEALRLIILKCGLTEEVKWGVPCYTFAGKNVILLGAFKDHCNLSFIKGVLLQDKENILLKPGENSQSVRVVNFTQVEKIRDVEQVLETYIYEAIEAEKAGLKVPRQDPSELELDDELLQYFNEDATFHAAFDALSPGRQRGYNMFFSAAKQAQTRRARIQKFKQRILDGKGMNDCVCGLSKRMPNCDGSHKILDERKN